MPLLLAGALCHLGLAFARTVAAAPSGTIGSLSARAYIGSGDGVLVSGFILEGSNPKQVLIRGLGPSLGVSSAFADPTLELLDANGSAIGFNNNWRDSQEQAILASGHAPPNDLESAIVATLPPGHYTVALRGHSGAAGIGKAEVIDIDSASDSHLESLSTRTSVGPGENTLVGGFVINGPQAHRVIVRAAGPSWDQYIAGMMRDPTLELRDSSGTVLVFNDDWQDTQSADVIATDMPPAHPRESAIVATLPPGSYTVHLIGACGRGGIAILDIYDLGVGSASTIPASSPLPTCFDTWAVERGLSGAAATPQADLDGDGAVNLLEYAFGKDPTAADGSGITSGTAEANGVKYLSLSYTRPVGDDAPSDLVYSAERASSLASPDWSASSTRVVTHSVTPGPGALETVTIRSTSPFGSTAGEFLRVKVALTPP